MGNPVQKSFIQRFDLIKCRKYIAFAKEKMWNPLRLAYVFYGWLDVGYSGYVGR